MNLLFLKFWIKHFLLFDRWLSLIKSIKLLKFDILTAKLLSIQKMNSITFWRCGIDKYFTSLIAQFQSFHWKYMCIDFKSVYCRFPWIVFNIIQPIDKRTVLIISFDYRWEELHFKRMWTDWCTLILNSQILCNFLAIGTNTNGFLVAFILFITHITNTLIYI